MQFFYKSVEKKRERGKNQAMKEYTEDNSKGKDTKYYEGLIEDRLDIEELPQYEEWSYVMGYLWWSPLRVCTILGIITQVSATNKRFA